jgi:hypothetical protein
MTPSDERLDAYLWKRLSGLLAASGVDDTWPGSMTLTRDGDGFAVAVESVSRGRVVIGAITPGELDEGVATMSGQDLDAWRARDLSVRAWGFDIMRDYAEELVTKRVRAPLDAKRRKKAGREERAYALRDEGRTVAYIARHLGLHERTVERYLADRESATDRETPG